MRFLLFTLYAPLASWGDIAVGEVRGSWDRPSRSAVLGICAAAVGLDREAQDEHDALADSFGVAVRADRTGRTLVDYHTAQTVAERDVRRVRPRTRRELLAAGERQTILSRRTLHQDALSTVALWEKQDATRTLGAIETALRKPVFTLYAGRKANALGLPLDPRIVDAATLGDAFAQRPPLPEGLPALEALCASSAWGREVSHDALREDLLGMSRPAFRTETRRDDRPHRKRWQFAERPVFVSLLPGGPS